MKMMRYQLLTQNVPLHFLIEHKLVYMSIRKYNHLSNSASNLHCTQKSIKMKISRKKNFKSIRNL